MMALIFVLATLLIGSAGEAATLSFIDDAGQTVQGPLEICVAKSHGLPRDCSSLPAGSELLSIGDFGWIRVEGPEHGPVTALKDDLRRTDRQLTITVPRKATLRVVRRSSPEEKLTLSLYSQTDSSFRQPTFRDRVEREELNIPAGSFMASLSFSKLAPDLRLLEIEPGGSYSITPRRMRGWSLLVRTIDSGGNPIRGATVEIAASPGFDRLPESPRQAPQQGTSNNKGLTIVSGLTAAIATSKAEHPGYFTARNPTLSSTPGSFTFTETVLNRGGVVRTNLWLRGEPVAGSECVIHRYPAYSSGGPREPPEVMSRVKSGRDGVCRSERILGGEYMLRVRLPGWLADADAVVEKSVVIVEDEEIEVDLDLEMYKVEGVVYRGDEPTPGYSVAMFSHEAPKPSATEADATARRQTDLNGKYEMTLWAAGRYSIFVMHPDGSPAAMKEVTLTGAVEVVDFRLAAQELSGIVVDGKGERISDAMVTLRWQRHSHRLARTLDDGSFSFAVDGESGLADVQARKDGISTQRRVADFDRSRCVFGSLAPRAQTTNWRDRDASVAFGAAGSRWMGQGLLPTTPGESGTGRQKRN